MNKVYPDEYEQRRNEDAKVYNFLYLCFAVIIWLLVCIVLVVGFIILVVFIVLYFIEQF